MRIYKNKIIIGAIVVLLSFALLVLFDKARGNDYAMEYSTARQEGLLEFVVYEFEDGEYNTWVDIQVELDSGARDDDGELVPLDKFDVYFDKVFSSLRMSSVQKSTQSGIHTIKASTKTPQVSAINASNQTEFRQGFFVTTRKFEIDNPFDNFWQIINGGQDSKGHIVQDFAHTLMCGGNVAIGTKSLKDGLNIAPSRLADSFVRYYFHTNRNIKTSARKAIVYRKDFFVFESALSASQPISFLIKAPNAIGYYVVTIATGVLAVIGFFVVTRRNRELGNR